MRRLIAVLMMCLAVHAQAATVPAYSPRFGQAMAGVIETKASSMGFAANDPRIAATEAGIGTVLTGIAVSLASAAGLPLWATIAVGGLTAVAVSLGVGALTSWLFNADRSVSVAGAGTGGITAGGSAYTVVGPDGATYVGGDGAGIQLAALEAAYSYAWHGIAYNSSAGGLNYYDAYANDDNHHTYLTIGTATPVTASATCSGYMRNDVCVPGTPPAPVIQAPSDAVAAVPSGDMTLPVNPQILAAAANNAWQQAAAQPGYQGVPYQASNPVTSTDVEAWRSANASAYPTVGDLLSPAVNPATSTVPFVGPGVSANPGTNTGPAGSTQVNVGPDPAIPAPALEAAPTAAQILAPLLNLMPDLKAYTVPAHEGTCPSVTFSLFERSIAMDQHCTLLESVRTQLFAVMALVWAVLAVMIVLTA